MNPSRTTPLLRTGLGLAAPITVLLSCSTSAYRSTDYQAAEFNWWRTAPATAESDSLVALRLKNHVENLIVYINHALVNDYVSVPLDGFHSPFVFGTNGIGVRQWNRVSSQWKQCFYSTEQAYRAYEMINFNFGRVRWRSDGNTFEAHLNYLVAFNQGFAIPARRTAR